MDLARTIGSEHSKSQCLKVADFVGNNPTRFKALIEVFFGGPYRLTQRAAWPMSICVERNPGLIIPHLNKLLSFATLPGAHDAVKRNTMRLLQFVEIPKRFHGKALDLAFAFLMNRKEAVAIRVFSMTVISNLTTDQPDLRRELCILLEDEMPFGTAAFRSRASKILRDEKKLEGTGKRGGKASRSVPEKR